MELRVRSCAPCLLGKYCSYICQSASKALLKVLSSLPTICVARQPSSVLAKILISIHSRIILIIFWREMPPTHPSDHPSYSYCNSGDPTDERSFKPCFNSCQRARIWQITMFSCFWPPETEEPAAVSPEETIRDLRSHIERQEKRWGPWFWFMH